MFNPDDITIGPKGRKAKGDSKKAMANAKKMFPQGMECGNGATLRWKGTAAYAVKNEKSVFLGFAGVNNINMRQAIEELKKVRWDLD